MAWARVAVVAGLMLLFAAFAFGTEHHRSASIAGQTYGCGAAIPASWFAPGTPDATLSAQRQGSADERRAAAACDDLIRESRVVTLTAMGVGGLFVVIGWTVLRERASTASPSVSATSAV